jgi:hypothetical protein
MRRRGTLVALALGLVGTVAPVRAAGPLLVNGAGTPYVWTADPVPFNPDRGTLGARSNAAAVADVSSNFAVWTDVATASVRFTDAGALPVDVGLGNYDQYLGACGDGLSPIIFDTDGRITDDVFGAGASGSVLGFAGPECGTDVPPVITEAVAVLNGKWVDGIQTPSNPELPVAVFNAVFVHEFGHYVNLDHSQVGLAEAFDADPGNDGAIATMFPFLIDGTAGASLALDDEVAVSALYPEAAFGTGFGTIVGTIRRSDGVTPFQGAYVIARQVGDPRVTAVGAASGARWFPGAPGGPPPAALQGRYELPGLPPGSYTVEIEPIAPVFQGGSSVGPLDPPAVLPGPPEFWNDASEAATSPPDDPEVAVPVAIAAGATISGVDVVLNVPTPPANDACSAATVVGATPFLQTLRTDFATTAPSDPDTVCGTGQDSNSVWYSFTPPAGGVVGLSTAGSSYDTVVTAFTGSCGTLAPVACNDDTGGGRQSAVAFTATGGTTYLIEVTDFSAPGGGTLRFSLVFTLCGNGALDAGETCDAGSANGSDGCCSAACTLIDADGDGVCDRDDTCPTDVDPGQEDADGDGLGDACDLCRTLVPGQTMWIEPRLLATGVDDGRDGNDGIRLSGRFALAPGAFTTDPLVEGATVELRSRFGLPLLRVVLPPGPFGSERVGWTHRGGRYTFFDKRPGGTGGIGKLALTDEGGGVVALSLQGKRGTFGLVATDAPLAATVVAGGAGAGAVGACGEFAFAAAPPGAFCALTKGGTRISCR